ncbi:MULTISPECIES: 2-amino-4-hydroxy-6-hydroxymethyldihydropteridine diphosphokinase [unclassified Prochlorococcus]|uniref:2-amino-4-hydroxy-6- hydroxymethyldihydropteridine diphosphokinase n=1 Tax=unclassified Prochlorococcus TaxID=2627481 RepID=UPI0005339288|nr:MULTISPECIES: 2-amino-4-hydroxy-6-hydroxymethyldihydropteridine diphosphokinase [unclassified Prochlorococcus]KGG16641.1 2-amino-4-hydroxy-6- hydroxymethyldihydropteridine pyrophosphokinase [Prochlorococcus sp. MIT 0602]KGG18387.1 2-amino-4-hydroxy-6- hydroxymethyldihydropteridine pyrophosphokinase [Prochlorococcus sp. MIT 0603]
MSSQNNSIPKSLSIGLGGNINSPIGPPELTLIKAKPYIEQVINVWTDTFLESNGSKNSLNLGVDLKINFHWSPLYLTEPIGGPKGQPNFVNAALVAEGGELEKLNPSVLAAKDLLKRFLEIEKMFGRDRSNASIHWGPRSLDIDFLSWGNLKVQSSELTLPHPRLSERDFVIIPLAEALQKKSNRPIKISPQHGWED